MIVDEVVDGVGMLVETVGKALPVDIVLDGPVDRLVMVEELYTLEVVVSGIRIFVDDLLVSVVVIDCVVMLVVLEEFWTVVVFICGVVMPGKNSEGRAVEIVVKVVGVLLPVGELWTAGLVTCVNLLVENFEVVAVVVNMFSLGIGMLAEKVGEGVALEMVVRSVNMFVTVEELWMVDVVFGGICTLADDIVVTAVVEECVEMLPQFSSQHNTLIS